MEITLTEKQQNFVNKTKDDFFKNPKHIFVLKGFAGTGKTVTSSFIAKNPEFEKILVGAPTIKAKEVLRKKLVQAIPNKRVDYTTVSKLLEIPSEIITVMNKTFQLDKEGMTQLTEVLNKLKMPADEIIIERNFINIGPDGEKFNDTKYIINEPLLKNHFVKKFKNLADTLVGPVEPSFNFKANDLITDVLCQYDLVMIDELSMVGNKSLEVLIEAWNSLNEYYKNNNAFYISDNARRKGLKNGKIPTLVFAGDGGQLPPVEDVMNDYLKLDDEELINKPFVSGVVTLTEILRSTDDIAKVASLIRKKMDLKQVAKIAPDGQIFNGDLDDYIRKHSDVFKEIDIALAYTRTDVAKLNKTIREVKGFTGKSANENEVLTVLSNSPADEFNEPYFTNGEEIKIIKIYDTEEAMKFYDDKMYDDLRDGVIKVDDNDIDLIKTGLMAGFIDYVMIEDEANIKKNVFISKEILRPIEGEIKVLFEIINDLAKLVNGRNPMIKADFGYARTIHKSQGSEWGDVFGWITSRNIYGLKQRDPEHWQSLPYTMFTRGRHKVRFVYAEY